MFACWLPLLLIRFPGNLDPDTLWQLMQTRGLAQQSNHHPWFDTMFFSTFWNLGDVLGSHAWSLGIYALLQMCLTALVLSLALSYLRFVIPAGRHLPAISKLFYCLYPAIPLFSMTMMKDSVFAVFWIPFLICFYEIVRTRGVCLKNRLFSVFFAIVILMLMLTKKTGVYLVVLSAIPLVLACRGMKKVLCLTWVFAPVAMFLLVWESLLLPMMGVIKGGEGEIMSLPSQQVAYYLQTHGDEMTPAGWDALRGVYTSPELLASSYQPGRADFTKRYWKQSTPKERAAFFAWYGTEMFRHPGTFALPALANTLPIYFPDTVTEDDESLIFYRNNLKSSEMGDAGLEQTLLEFSGGLGTKEGIADMMSGAYRNPLVSKMSDSFDVLLRNFMSATFPLFVKCLFTWWIPVLVFLGCLRQKNLRGMLTMIPTIIAWLTLIAGPIALPRYMVPFVFSAPLLLASPWIGHAAPKAGEAKSGT